MEQAILLGCVVAPAIISLAFVLLAIGLSRKQAARSVTAAAVSLSIGWCAAVASSLLLRQELDWAALDAWQMVLVPITLSAVGWTLTMGLAELGREVRWIVLCIGCLVSAMIAMPSGEAWLDTLPLHRGWMVAVAGSSLLNVWMLNRMIDRGAARWVLLVSLAGLAGPTLLAAGAYAGLAEWLLGALVTTLVFTIALNFSVALRPQWIIVPASLFAACATASGRFYTYDDHAPWLYAVILLIPSLIAVLDECVWRWSTTRRLAIAGVVSAVLLSGIAWYMFGEIILKDAVQESW